MQGDRDFGENAADRDTNAPDQVDIEQVQTGDPGRMMHSDMERLKTEQNPMRTPLTKEEEEGVVNENYKQDIELNQ